MRYQSNTSWLQALGVASSVSVLAYSFSTDSHWRSRPPTATASATVPCIMIRTMRTVKGSLGRQTARRFRDYGKFTRPCHYETCTFSKQITYWEAPTPFEAKLAKIASQLYNNAENVPECHKMPHFSSFFAVAVTLSGLPSIAC